MSFAPTARLRGRVRDRRAPALCEPRPGAHSRVRSVTRRLTQASDRQERDCLALLLLESCLALEARSYRRRDPTNADVKGVDCFDKQEILRAGSWRRAFRHDCRPASRLLTGCPGRRDRPSKRLEVCRDARPDDNGRCRGAWAVQEDRARRLRRAEERLLHVLVPPSGSRRPRHLPPHPGPLDARTRFDFHRDPCRPHGQMPVALGCSALAAVSETQRTQSWPRHAPARPLPADSQQYL